MAKKPKPSLFVLILVFAGGGALLKCEVFSARIEPIPPIHRADPFIVPTYDRPFRFDVVGRARDSSWTAEDMERALRNNPNVLLQNGARMLIRYSYERKRYSPAYPTLTCLSLGIIPLKQTFGGFVEFEIYDRLERKSLTKLRYEVQEVSHSGASIPLISPFVFLARSLGLAKNVSVREGELKILRRLVTRWIGDVRNDSKMKEYIASLESGASLPRATTLVREFTGHPGGARLRRMIREQLNRRGLWTLGPEDSPPGDWEKAGPESILEGELTIKQEPYSKYQDFILKLRLRNTKTGRIELNGEYEAFASRIRKTDLLMISEEEQKAIDDLTWALKSLDIQAGDPSLP